MEQAVHTIDAAGRAPGRVASEVAVLLMGKHKADFARNKVGGDKVEVVNAKKIKIDPKKLTGKIYYRHTNYPGGLRETTLKRQMEKDATKVILMAVNKMLPKNKLRKEMLKNLTITA